MTTIVICSDRHVQHRQCVTRDLAFQWFLRNCDCGRSASESCSCVHTNSNGSRTPRRICVAAFASTTHTPDSPTRCDARNRADTSPICQSKCFSINIHMFRFSNYAVRFGGCTAPDSLGAGKYSFSDLINRQLWATYGLLVAYFSPYQFVLCSSVNLFAFCLQRILKTAMSYV